MPVFVIISFFRCRGGGIGRRTGLKIQRLKERIGSIPILGTIKINMLHDFNENKKSKSNVAQTLHKNHSSNTLNIVCLTE